MACSKLINSPSVCVDECLQGLVLVHPHLTLHAPQRVVFDTVINENRKVGVISGGGAGHEPFCAGYVGGGMLQAAISGSVFASPPSSHILHAIRVSSSLNEGGILLIIPNYTGDVLNFGLAAELATKEGLKVNTLVVGEDIALSSHGVQSSAGNRGMCGLVVVFKIAGYLSSIGESLKNIHETSKKVVNNLASIGVALKACSLPGAGPLFELQENEMDIGVGVHGEAGVKRTQVQTAEQVVSFFLKHLMNHLQVKAQDEVAVWVNNLGALSQLEQWVVAKEIHTQLTSVSVVVQRMYVGSLFTSLNMAGVQICMLKVIQSERELYLRALDAKTEAPAWPGCVSLAPRCSIPLQVSNSAACRPTIEGPTLSTKGANILKLCLSSIALSLIKSEARLNELDSGCGDGDCGTTLRHLAQSIINTSCLPYTRPAEVLNQVGNMAQETMGGTSGAIYSLFLTAATAELEKHSEIDVSIWANCWRRGIEGIKKYSYAKLGDRTLLDALEPACDNFESTIQKTPEESVQALERALMAAEDGCERTKHMIARAGRASYVDRKQVKDVDAGASAVVVWLRALLSALRSESDN